MRYRFMAGPNIGSLWSSKRMARVLSLYSYLAMPLVCIPGQCLAVGNSTSLFWCSGPIHTWCFGLLFTRHAISYGSRATKQYPIAGVSTLPWSQTAVQGLTQPAPPVCMLSLGHQCSLHLANFSPQFNCRSSVIANELPK